MKMDVCEGVIKGLYEWIVYRGLVDNRTGSTDNVFFV